MLPLYDKTFEERGKGDLMSLQDVENLQALFVLFQFFNNPLYIYRLQASVDLLANHHYWS